MKQSNTFKRLGTGIVLTAFLVCCFLGTSLSLRPAYAWENAPILSMNGGAPVIAMGENEFLEPGMTIQKKFKIQNLTGMTDEATAKAYNYGFYFGRNPDPTDPTKYESLIEDENKDEDELVEVLEISILDEHKNVLITDTLASMHIGNIKSAISNNTEDIIEAGATKNLILQIHYPSDVGNVGMGKSIENFDIYLAFKEVNSVTP